MLYLADTANLEELRELFYYFPLEGITTNPTILKQEGKALSVIIPELLKIVGDKMLHIQMYQAKHQDIVAEAKFYKRHFNLGDNFYAKVPVTAEGYKAISLLKKEGFKSIPDRRRFSFSEISKEKGYADRKNEFSCC